MKENKKIGAVLVMGGGIGGMQAALDLAEAGIKVYLMDNKPCIGGVMAQLDKTFPTNDCAMCTMAPRLVEIGRHKDIEIITMADVEEIHGQPGDFRVTLKKRARYIKEEKCTGCGECAEDCPVELPSRFNMNLDHQKAIYRLYPQAVPNTFAIEKGDFPPCRYACPAGVNIQGFIALVSKGKFAEALALYRERNPFPATCGRICHHPCEQSCNREEIDEPLACRALHRFLADLEMKNHSLNSSDCSEPKEMGSEEIEEPAKRKNGQKVAIVGSGPAGLTAACDLARAGYQPTVFEALPVTGGMLRVGIPRYRLPEEILDYEIEAVKKTGVEIRTNTPIGPDLTLSDLFEQGYKAIFIAIGTHKSRRLNIEGEDLKGVIHGISFLGNVKVGRREKLDGKVVVVIGGGNVAMDSVRTALRLGAKRALIVYRRSREEIPASDEELEACQQEGVEIYYLAAPRRILGKDGKVTGVECLRMRLGPKDKSGRRRPLPLEGSEFIIDADIVIPAISQEADLSLLSEVKGLEVTKDGILPTEGIDLEGVRGFTDFLRATSLGKKIDIGERIIVIGGGNVAVDVARTALRVGGKEIHLVCLEKREEMPAFREEVGAAEEEGIIIHNSLAPRKILGKDGKAVGVEFLKCVSVFDREGKFSPRFKENTESILPAETVIVAIGQVADYTLLKAADGVLITKAGQLKVDEITLATNVPGIFAGGDVIGGPGVALEAIIHGHEAATSIDRFLRGEDLKAGREKKRVKLAETPAGETEFNPREKMPLLPLKERVESFQEIELGFSEEQAVEEAKRCLNCGICSECLMCVDSCKAEAIDHQMSPATLLDLQVGAVILSPGYEIFDAGTKLEYSYLRSKNVITALEFERILSASGPYSGKVLRPSDNCPPKRIAFIQCVGSRDSERDYCSSVCCMYATKEAIIAKEHAGEDLECHIFFMDLRAFGKGFDDYYERAKELGVKYIRCRPSSIEEVQETGNLRIQYLTEEGKIGIQEYDLVVLSTGLQPPRLVKQIAERFGLELNEHGFCKTLPFDPVQSSREGIFACGPFTEPKDIPETVVQASGAASKALTLLSEVKGSLITHKEYPPERDVAGEAPRIGVFICHCGANIAGIVNVPEVVEYAKTLPDVVCVEDNLYTCSNDTQEKIKEAISEHKLNRLVVASCTPRTHEPLFRSTIREAGLNPYLFEMANIRDQCSWVHMHEPERATVKAKDLVRMAVAKSRLLEPLQRKSVTVNHNALVVGGGLSGMTAALELAGQGFKVYLVEKEKELGGNLRRLHFLLNGGNPQEQLESLVKKIRQNDRIHTYLDAKMLNMEGSLGNFKTTIEAGDRRQVMGNGKRPNSPDPSLTTHNQIVLEHGVIIIATGAREYRPAEYLYGKDERVITQLELEERLAKNVPVLQCSGAPVNQKSEDESTVKPERWNTVVMIQCVGSRDKERPYCSRVCCAEAVKNALKIKKLCPETSVFILYRDIRTYGFQESCYRKAREMGVFFIRYEEERKPEVNKSAPVLQCSGAPVNENTDAQEPLKVAVCDPVLQRELIIDADLVVLSAATVPHEENKDLTQMLKVPLNQDDFFLEAHMKLRPVDFATEGIFLCGLAHSAKSVEESIAQACGAAARASTILSKDILELEANISQVIDENCDGCAYCIDPCSYDAVTLIEYMKEGAIKKTVEIDETKCKGCGVCQATCPKKGIFVRGFKPEQISAMVEAALVR